MKNTVFYLIVIMALFSMSCEEDDNRGQFAVDHKAPGLVSEIKVENEKGFSVLTYTNPLDEDLLYVEAKYINSLGNEAIVRASAFTNTMKLNGFLRSAKVPVDVIAVDKSLNASKATQIEIEPLDNTMFDVFESLNFQAAFGGIKLFWMNEAEQELVIDFLIYNQESNTFSDYESIFTTAVSVNQTVRGLEAVENEFGVVIRDEYGQRTDTLKFKASPFFEEQIDPVAFRELPHNPDFNTISFTTGFASMFNGAVGKDSYSIFGSGIDRVYFTMDLGEKIKLSRFKMGIRFDFVYAHSQPRHILLLGTNDAAIANDPLSVDSEWNAIGEWYDEKPSGNPANIAPTEEDQTAFDKGIDFEIDINASSYQYLRFVTLESWGQTDRMWLGELTFWGERN
ncbi:DUF4959 domain-containing protein [Cellulophaga sp. F20128]|uniref:DUF5000 domain-containing lipoprotein n=1 Tax=Cellulophaga sp. F20128 TaxID=2926413 RepID=UPI001FF4A0C3|nr:DUF5000 domain-containing lipoprotein [Cellulophaga sp. F20128]MCK0158291.1 DUF4959 domain-containing protein [Cellulophaga sp. F20128]